MSDVANHKLSLMSLLALDENISSFLKTVSKSKEADESGEAASIAEDKKLGRYGS